MQGGQGRRRRRRPPNCCRPVVPPPATSALTPSSSPACMQHLRRHHLPGISDIQDGGAAAAQHARGQQVARVSGQGRVAGGGWHCPALIGGAGLIRRPETPEAAWQWAGALEAGAGAGAAAAVPAAAVPAAAVRPSDEPLLPSPPPPCPQLLGPVRLDQCGGAAPGPGCWPTCPTTTPSNCCCWCGCRARPTRARSAYTSRRCARCCCAGSPWPNDFLQPCLRSLVGAGAGTGVGGRWQVAWHLAL